MTVQGPLARMLDMNGTSHPSDTYYRRRVDRCILAIIAARFTGLSAAIENTGAEFLALVFGGVLVALHRGRMFAAREAFGDLHCALDILQLVQQMAEIRRTYVRSSTGKRRLSIIRTKVSELSYDHKGEGCRK